MIARMKEVPLCTNCLHVVTNPLCPYCFSRHVLLWLRDKDISKKEAEKILGSLRKFVLESEESSSEEDCVICGKEEVYLCTFCFIEKASEIIEKYASSEIAEKFADDFNAKMWKRY